MKHRIKWALLLVIIIAGGIMYSFVDRNVSTYTSSADNTEMVSGYDVYDGNRFSYTFECGHDNLQGIRIIADVYGNKEGSLEVTVYDQAGHKVSEGSVKASKIKDQMFTTIDIDEIEDSENTIYTVSFSCSNEYENRVNINVIPNTDSSEKQTAAVQYTYGFFDIETLIMFYLMVAYLFGFGYVLMNLFRK